MCHMSDAACFGFPELLSLEPVGGFPPPPAPPSCFVLSFFGFGGLVMVFRIDYFLSRDALGTGLP